MQRLYEVWRVSCAPLRPGWCVHAAGGKQQGACCCGGERGNKFRKESSVPR